MKKIFFLIFSVFIIVSNVFGNETSQKNCVLKEYQNSQYKDSIPLIDSSATYYWYYIKPVFDRKTKTIKIRFLNKRPKSGVMLAYERNLWKTLQQGQQIIIGPFNTITDTENSMLYYQIASGFLDSIIVNSEKEIYWNKLYWGFTPRTHSIVYDLDIEVQKGKRTDYIQELKSSLQKNILLVGPWSDYQYFEQIRPKPRRCTAFDNE